jgi:CheY-like chemotaxis protein
MGETETAPRPTALVVDDEKEVADAYALRLRDLCDVETVYEGRKALESVENDEIDIVLLDRHMPGMSGDEVLAELNDRDYYGRVIMVTAIDPGFDVLDMPFDDYLCKPVDREDVTQAVSHQCTVLGYETLGEYFSVESKRRVIAAEIGADARGDHEGYQETKARAAELKKRANRVLEDAESVFAEFDAVARESQ